MKMFEKKKKAAGLENIGKTPLPYGRGSVGRGSVGPVARTIDKMVSAVSPAAGIKRAQARAVLGTVYPDVSRTGGGLKGTMGNWLVSRLNRFTEETQRVRISDRAADLAANDPHAASVIDSMALNAVGCGIVPQATPHQEILGWTDTQVTDFQTQAEWAFSVWAKDADAAGRMPFWMIQYLSVYSLLVAGEYVRIPVMLDTDIRRRFSLAIQCVHPSRMGTPSDVKITDNVRDGVRLNSFGAPVSYYIYNPTATRSFFSRSGINPAPTSEFSNIPAWIAHRPGMFHGFVPKTEEQVRGVSILAPAMKFFRDLSDYLDFELVGAIIAASFAVFVETANPYDTSGQPLADGETYKEVNPGQILYGSPGEKPHILAPNRPGDTFPAFVERVLRAVGASCGMPYEIIAKDFSKTNYSSARAALLEAWRVFSFYQKWLVDAFCQPVWDMVIEEAWLRDMIQIPAGTDFYRMRPEICRAAWIPPRRGHVDPVKEIEALVTGMENHLTTLSEAAAEMGGDWEGKLRQRAREQAMKKKLGLEDVKKEKKPNEPGKYPSDSGAGKQPESGADENGGGNAQ